MKSHFIVLLVIASIIGSGTPSTTAQVPVVVGPEFTLTHSSVTRTLRGERSCNYFLWTTLGVTAQRLSFNYIADSTGRISEEAPQIKYVTLVMDPSKTIPTARIVGTGDFDEHIWEVSISEDVYAQNKKCLVGIVIKQTK